jgi:hypothetical protein
MEEPEAQGQIRSPQGHGAATRRQPRQAVSGERMQLGVKLVGHESLAEEDQRPIVSLRLREASETE